MKMFSKKTRPKFQSTWSGTARLVLGGLTLLFGVAASSFAEETTTPVDGGSGEFKILITPRKFVTRPVVRVAEQNTAVAVAQNANAAAGTTEAAPPPATKPGMPVIVPQPVRKPRYVDVYNSIPFSRSAWYANPSYRHDATIELLLGQIRPVTRIYNTAPAPAFEYVRPYRYYYRGRSVNYNFWYPRPTVYRNY